MAEMEAITEVSARGALTTIDQHCHTEVLCKFEGHWRKKFRAVIGNERALPRNERAIAGNERANFFLENFNEIANIASFWAE